MNKVMLCQPMYGRSDSEILKERKEVTEKLKRLGYEVIDSWVEEEAPPEIKNLGLFYLGKSLEKLSSADILFCMAGWEEGRGCRLEVECAREYGIEIVYGETKEKRK